MADATQPTTANGAAEGYGPGPAPTAHFEPVNLSFTRFERGKEPVVVTETRYMTFSIWAYRRMCQKAGISLVEMGKLARQRERRKADLIKQHGPKRGAEIFQQGVEKEMEKDDPLHALLPSAELDTLQKMAHIVWGALITEDAGLNNGRITLTMDEVEQLMGTPEQQVELFQAAASSLSHYLYGAGLTEVTEAAEQAKAAEPDAAEPEAGEPEGTAEPDPTPADGQA